MKHIKAITFFCKLIALLLLTFFCYKLQAYNFRLTNRGNVPVWFTLGDQYIDPTALTLHQLDSGKKYEEDVSLQNYPQLLVAYPKPEVGSIVYYAVVDHNKARNIENKTLFLIVEVRQDPAGIIFPLLNVEQSANNIAMSEITQYAKKYNIIDSSITQPQIIEPEIMQDKTIIGQPVSAEIMSKAKFNTLNKFTPQEIVIIKTNKNSGIFGKIEMVRDANSYQVITQENPSITATIKVHNIGKLSAKFKLQ